MAGYIGSKASVSVVSPETDSRYVNVTGDTMTGALAVNGNLTVDTNTLFVDAANNRVGVGTSSPAHKLVVAGYSNVDAANKLAIGGNADYQALIYMESANETLTIENTSDYSGRATIFKDNGIERMRLDSSGNLLVGKTADSVATDGFQVLNDGYLANTVSGGVVAYFNRRTSDGSIIEFRKDNTTVGSIGNRFNAIYIHSPDGSGSGLRFASNIIQPCASNGNDRDNVIDLGQINSRFDDIYATNGTIQTSDRNEKQDIEELDEAERRVAVAAKGLLRKFRWIDAVAEKGDDARIHFGIIAQDLQAAFEAEGLDAGRYAMFISSTWWEADEVVPAVDEVLDDEGNVVTEAQPERTVTNTYQTAEEAPEGAVERTRMGIRYPQLLAFIIGAM